MEVKELFEGMAETLKKGLTVESIFGDPAELEGAVIIPVGKVIVASGGGGGDAAGQMGPADKAGRGEAGGGGGGFIGGVVPLGYISARDGAVEWVRILDWGRLTSHFITLCTISAIRLLRRWFRRSH